MARTETGGSHHCQLVALEEYPLAPHWDLSWDGKQSLLLAGHSGLGLTVAHTLGRAAVCLRHEVQPHHKNQESPPYNDRKEQLLVTIEIYAIICHNTCSIHSGKSTKPQCLNILIPFTGLQRGLCVIAVMLHCIFPPPRCFSRCEALNN